MKKPRSKFLLLLGIILTVGGMVGAGITYRTMKTQNMLYARQGTIQINLAKLSEWEKEQFTFYQPGDYFLYLANTNTFGKPYGTEPDPDAKYTGSFEVIVHDPTGKEFLHKQIRSSSIDHAEQNNMGWLTLDTLHIPKPLTGIWNISARVTIPDTIYSETVSEIFIMPPQDLDIGSYMYKQTFVLIGWALLMLVGFVMIVIGGTGKQSEDPGNTA